MVGQKSTNYYFGGKLRRDVKGDWVRIRPSIFFNSTITFFSTQPSLFLTQSLLYFELNHHLFFWTYRFFFLNMQNFDLKQ